MSFSFKYKPIKLKSGRGIYRPLIPLTLVGAEHLDVLAVLDSGSDMTVLPKEIAEVMNIKYFEEDELFGITGAKVKAKIGRITISFGKNREIYNFQIPVVVPDKENISVIIGRIGFFDNFKITFLKEKSGLSSKKCLIRGTINSANPFSQHLKVNF